MTKKKKSDFEYTYVAPTSEERKEIENIKNSYIKKEPTSSQTKLSRLRSLDMRVKNTPGLVGLIFGVVGLLIFGFGLSIILEIKSIPNFVGIILCVIGTVTMAIANPLYKITLKKLKKKYSKEIIKLSEELLNDKPNIDFND